MQLPSTKYIDKPFWAIFLLLIFVATVALASASSTLVYTLWPFGHQIVSGPNEPGCLSVVMNLLWIFLGWWEIALLHVFCGLLFCITIIGIPWGMQHFKMAIGSVFPFGKEIQ